MDFVPHSFTLSFCRVNSLYSECSSLSPKREGQSISREGDGAKRAPYRGLAQGKAVLPKRAAGSEREQHRSSLHCALEALGQSEQPAGGLLQGRSQATGSLGPPAHLYLCRSHKLSRRWWNSEASTPSSMLVSPKAGRWRCCPLEDVGTITVLGFLPDSRSW